MRLISYNVNGIRSAIKKGFLEWLITDPADVICLQEVKALRENIALQQIEDLGYQVHWFAAEKKGYSGVALLTKLRPERVLVGSGMAQSDLEGRVIRADYGSLTLLNCYFPSGTSGELRQSYKYQWLEEFYHYIQHLRQERPYLVVCGDYNIAHKPIDIHNPVGNKNSSGFLPEERAWMDRFLESGFTDSFRYVNPHPHQYTWWSQRFPSVRLQNKGWRIDYISVAASLDKHIRDAAIYPEVKHSDHCPVFLELDFPDALI